MRSTHAPPTKGETDGNAYQLFKIVLPRSLYTVCIYKLFKIVLPVPVKNVQSSKRARVRSRNKDNFPLKPPTIFAAGFDAEAGWISIQVRK